MAGPYTVAANDIAKHAFTLTANTVETVTFAGNIAAAEVISDGAAACFYTVDGSTPAVNGGNCYILPAGTTSVDTRRMDGSADVLKFISTGTPTLSVQRA